MKIQATVTSIHSGACYTDKTDRVVLTLTDNHFESITIRQPDREAETPFQLNERVTLEIVRD